MKVKPEQTSKPKSARKNALTKGSLFLLRLNIILCFVTLGLYYSCTIRPEDSWIMAGFGGFLIPPSQILLFLMACYWLYRKPFFSLFSILTLLLGIRFITATVGTHFLQTEPCGNLKVVSFNAKTFGGMDPERQGKNETCTKMVKQFLATKADVLCIQEMFDHPKSSIFNVVSRLKKGGYKYIYFSKSGTMRWGASVGVAICSKYPILSKSVIRKKDGSNNQIIRAKIDVDGRQVVIINMHLQSLFIKDEELNTKHVKKNVLNSVLGIARKMKVAYEARTHQIDLLLASTLDEDIPVIICGDMNDTPYSNAYVRLRDSYQNAFEEKGRGFGITYNGKLPFLRIDHQFANSKLKVTRFNVNKSLTESDHFATEACYKILESE